MSIRTSGAALVAIAALALTACGGGDEGAGSTTSSSTTSASRTSSSTSSPSETATAEGEYDATKCQAVAESLLDIANVSLDALSGDFTQEAYDKAFPAGAAEKFPAELVDAYNELANGAKDLVGVSSAEAAQKASELATKMTDYAQDVQKVCTP